MPYTKQQLYSIWYKYKDNPHVENIISKAVGGDMSLANKLINEFEIGRMSGSLGYSFRGKPDRVKRHV